MCGICGKLSWDSSPDVDLVKQMSDAIAHRGPDAEKLTVIGPMVMAHRRLAIIDLSPLGVQPMSDITGRFWIVFNGEIYNYQDVRRELQKFGVQFRSNSDTEVILEAYKKWGVKCLQKFNGMFAFALWDETTRRLFVARDRLGKKPFYYQILPDGGLLFASELKALSLDPVVSRRINPNALNHYLSLNYTLSSDAMFDGVRKLQAAHYMIVEQGKEPSEVSYWDLASHFADKSVYKSEYEAAEALRSLVDDSVRLRLISDVPLGVFLSGGIDSSAVVGSMRQFCIPDDIHSFSVGFREKGYSELKEAREIAELFAVNHRDAIVTPDIVELLPRIVYHADEPFADTSMIPMYLLAEFCRKYVTVCLSGDGGDEIFAGYETYAADRTHHWTRWIPAWASHLMYRAVDQWMPATYGKVSFDYKLRQFLEGHSYNQTRAHYHWREIFTLDEKRKILNPSISSIVNDSAYEYFYQKNKQVEACHYLDRGMYVDIKTWLVDDILVKVDRMTMAHALEARAPLLDYRVVEFAASLPVDLKMKFLQKKYLFKKSQIGRIPNKALKRPKKGFNSPVSHWLVSSLRESYYDLTINSSFARSTFDVDYIKKLWNEHENKKQDHGLKLFGLASLISWCEQNKAFIAS